MSVINKCSARGSVTIIVTALLPLFVVLLAFVVDAGVLLVTRTRLQIAADRAAYAAAASLTADLNRIAGLNWELAHQFREVERHFREHSEAEQSGDDELARAAVFQADRERAMREMAQSMSERAEAQARTLFSANVHGANIHFPIRPAGDFVNCFADDETGDLLRGHLTYDQIDGTIVFDPVAAREAAGGGDLIRYCNKDATALVAIGVAGETTFHPPLLTNFFGATPLAATAAAQPYGGSLKNFSAHDEVSATGTDLYRTAIVPTAAVAGFVDDQEERAAWLNSWH